MTDGLTPTPERWRELVVLLAERVFGWRRWWHPPQPDHDPTYLSAALFPPDRDMTQAFWEPCPPEVPVGFGAAEWVAEMLPATLDTIWQAEERLTAEQQSRYVDELGAIVHPAAGPFPRDWPGLIDDWLEWRAVHATVEQKMVALLRAVGALEVSDGE